IIIIIMGSEFSKNTLGAKRLEKTLKTGVKVDNTNTKFNNTQKNIRKTVLSVDEEDLLHIIQENMTESKRVKKGGWNTITARYNLRHKTCFDSKSLRSFYILHLKNRISNNNESYTNNENTLSESPTKIDENEIKEIDSSTNSIKNQKDEITNKNTKTSQKITQELLEIYESLKNVYFALNTTEMSNWIHTPKISSLNLNRTILSQLDTATRILIDETGMSEISEIIKILYSCQLVYFQKTRKQPSKTDWVANINNKIKERSYQLNIVNKYLKNEEFTIDEARNFKHICNRHRKMTKDKETKVTKNELREITFKLENEILLYKKRLEVHNNKKRFLRDNYLYECNRKLFYRNMTTHEKKDIMVDKEELIKFWEKIFESKDITMNQEREKLIKSTFQPIETSTDIDLSYKMIDEIINTLPNWKSAGIDKIYNFFIKNINSTRRILINEIQRLCASPCDIPEYLFKTITYMFPKKSSSKPSDYRPISCMSNIYKIITKVLSKNLYNILEINGIISQNQLGVRKNTMAAKEQVLFNHLINVIKNFKLKTIWFDVQKAYDSIPYDYVTGILERLNIPENYVNLMKRLQKNLILNIHLGTSMIGEIRPKRGILQGDSLSPLIFVLCMEPISRILNNTSTPKVELSYNNTNMRINHLFYMDDIKIFAESQEKLGILISSFMKTLETIGMKHNKEKSCTNTETYSEIADVINPLHGYKYLGLIEDADNKFKNINIESIFERISKRLLDICKTSLNSKNAFNALNEYSLSLINYFIGVIDIPQNILTDWDVKIRNMLREQGFHHLTACKERLYLNRSNLGRGLNSLEFQYDKILFNLLRKIESKSNFCPRSKIIKAVYENFMVTEKEFTESLRVKYELPDDTQINMKSLNDAFQRKLIKEIKTKEVHNKLFNDFNAQNEIKDSSVWLKRGKLGPRTEANLCNLQDRNIFYNKSKCIHCKNVTSTVDHLATRCEKMLHYDYKKRHDEIIKIIVISLLNKYTENKIKHYKYQRTKSVYETNNLKITVDIPIKTDVLISDNRPDIVVINKNEKKIFFIEIGITNIDNLKQTESWKRRKYELLGREYGRMMNMEVTVIPFVMSWDGHVTSYNKKYREIIGMNYDVFGYVQSVCLNKTFECVQNKRDQQNQMLMN
ncbi:LINE-1 retrotransposable element ORF2 protein, partial [Dictyocoela muelleri]